MNRRPEPAVSDAWNIAWVKSYIESCMDTLAPSTIFNYLCALQAMQRYTQLNEEFDPPSILTLQFQALLKTWGKKKSDHRHLVAERKRKNTVQLHEVERTILSNSAVHQKFKEILNRALHRPILTSEYSWAVGYTILSLQSSNFKRNGNLTKIDFAPAMKSIKAALKRRKTCEIEILGASKSGGVEVFSVVNRQRLKTLWDYGRVLRPTVQRKEANESSFFLNSIGKPLRRPYNFVKALGISVGLPNLNIRDLRSRIETEAALRSDSDVRKSIADHLAHTEATRDRHYLIPDRRRSRKAALCLEELVKRAKPEESEGESSVNDSLPSFSDNESSNDATDKIAPESAAESSTDEIDTSSVNKSSEREDTPLNSPTSSTGGKAATGLPEDLISTLPVNVLSEDSSAKHSASPHSSPRSSPLSPIPSRPESPNEDSPESPNEDSSPLSEPISIQLFSSSSQPPSLSYINSEDEQSEAEPSPRVRFLRNRTVISKKKK